MQNAINYVADEALPFRYPDASLPIPPDTEPYSGNSRPGTAIPWRLYRAGKAAAAYFGYETLIGRVALVSFSVLIISVALVVTIARTQATPRTFDLPEALLQRNMPPSLATCENLHDGNFNCTLDNNGEKVTLDFNGVLRSASYTSKSIQKLTLGDLVVAWGAPSSLAFYPQELVVVWGPRTAYFHGCTFRPDSGVEYLAYNLSPQTLFPWHGFVSSTAQCAAGY